MSGYVDYSKSVNAVEAEAGGRFPKSVLAKKYGIKTSAIDDLLEPTEWHHTSKFYNRTNYYSEEEVVRYLDCLKRYSKAKTPELRELAQREFEKAENIWWRKDGLKFKYRVKPWVDNPHYQEQARDFAKKLGIESPKSKHTKGYTDWDDWKLSGELQKKRSAQQLTRNEFIKLKGQMPSTKMRNPNLAKEQNAFRRLLKRLGGETGQIGIKGILKGGGALTGALALGAVTPDITDIPLGLSEMLRYFNNKGMIRPTTGVEWMNRVHNPQTELQNFMTMQGRTMYE